MNEGIGKIGGTLMVAVAVLFDFVQFLLTISVFGMALAPLVSLIAIITFGIWLAHYNMSIFSARRIARFGLTTIGELIPGIDALPLWSITIGYTVLTNLKKPQV